MVAWPIFFTAKKLFRSKYFGPICFWTNFFFRQIFFRLIFFGQFFFVEFLLSLLCLPIHPLEFFGFI
jgi:hypothetical protein